MDSSNVPQDNIPVFAGHSKAVYALDSHGNYTLTTTSGWEVEEIVTRQALDELAHKRQVALAAHRSGKLSPLPYHMYDKKMDVATLARESGFWQWRVRRHFRPDIFQKLSPEVLAVYADVLGISPVELQHIDDARD